MKTNNTIEKIDLDQLADALKSMAHPERLAILHLMSNFKQIIVRDVYQALNLDQPTTSRHLSILKRAGLLKRDIKNGKTLYGINTGNGTALCIKQFLMGLDEKNRV